MVSLPLNEVLQEVSAGKTGRDYRLPANPIDPFNPNKLPVFAILTYLA